MITSIHYTNFKALKNFSLYLKDFNVLTGPNNNGKSTLLDGLRVLQAAYRYAVRYNPTFINNPHNAKVQLGYVIPKSSIPISVENVQTDYNTSEPAIIEFKLD
ncbi:MAG TPA: AAA family ATPase [Bacteroidia bacterium]|jgi:AAA15 family ATPase/GTPase|nr:AAA family ATPase [Bacteroidia bacterium]